MLDPYSLFRMIWLLFGAMAIAMFSLLGRAAHAYVPKARVILEKVGKQHGKGGYVVQQEVTFRDEKGPLTVIEEWLVESGDSMALEVRGGGQRASATYKGRQKLYVDDKGTERSGTAGGDFFEPVFYYRGWDPLAEFLVKEKILPTKNLPRENFKKETKEFGYVPDPFVRLSRTAGVVAFALGTPTPAESATALPGLWVEQDRFLIRRLRLDTQAEVTADEYTEYSNNLWFPKVRTVSWGDQSVHMRVIKVSATKATPSARKRPDGAKETFTSPVIAEFYKRFR
ncbi:MAG TPA: hypothetical protein VFV50_10950 [Bdellovibrionales bacterium]|nr:hypothetical protein [Bdellovibrionales bacterium]